MEIQANSTPFQSRIPNLEHSEHAQVGSDIRCVVKTRKGMHEYWVADLTVSGALLTGGPRLRDRCPLIVLLRVPCYPEVRIPARVVRVGTDDEGYPVMRIDFAHRSDVTEDHIQSALLSELERSRNDGCIADVLLS